MPEGSTVDSLQQSGGVEAAVTRARAETTGLRDALYQMLVDAAHLGVDRGQADTEAALGVGSTKADASVGLVDWTLVNSDARDWASEYAGELVSGINETTAKVLRSALAEWIDNKLSYAQLLREVASAFGDKRAQSIVETEVCHAYSYASMAAWRAGGIITACVWASARDERTCPICGGLDGTVAQVIDGNFTHPGGEGDRAKYEGQTFAIPPGHVRCLPGDTRVSSSERITASSERRYDGDLVVIRTASGNRLACTPNHPILTPAGWLAAGFLDVGGYVLSSRSREWESGIHVDHEDVPARIQDVAKSFVNSREMIAIPVPTTAEDFHGDGVGSKVAVVRADRLLGNRLQMEVLNQDLSEQFLGGRDVVLVGLIRGGVGKLLTEGDRSPSRCQVCGGDLGIPLEDVHSRPLETFGSALVSDRDASLLQAQPDRPTVHAVGLGDGVLRLATEVAADDLGIRQRRALLGNDEQADASFSEPGADSLRADAELAGKLIGGAAGPIFPDEVVGIERNPFSGQVYNLQTDGGWYVAEGIVTHNCRCWLRPRV